MSEQTSVDPVEAYAQELGFIETEQMRDERQHIVALLADGEPNYAENDSYRLGVEDRHRWRQTGRNVTDTMPHYIDDIVSRRYVAYIGVRLMNASMMRDACHTSVFLSELGYTEKYVRSSVRRKLVGDEWTDEEGYEERNTALTTIADRIKELRS